MFKNQQNFFSMLGLALTMNMFITPSSKAMVMYPCACAITDFNAPFNAKPKCKGDTVGQNNIEACERRCMASGHVFKFWLGEKGYGQCQEFIANWKPKQ